MTSIHMVKLGKAFSDSVTIEKRMRNHSSPPLTGWGARITLLYILLIGLFFLLLVRLFHLTIVKGAENRRLSESNRIRTAIIHAPRGIFKDRTGKPLVENIPAYRITGPCADESNCRLRLISQEEWQKSGQKISALFEKDYLRHYLYSYELSHVFGYLNEITDEEIHNPLYQYQDYLFGDRIGRVGLESVYERRLRGVDGKELLEVDAQNNVLRHLGQVNPIPGEDIVLSLDESLQKTAYEALGENPGAVIVTKTKTGEVLALVSTPSYDSNKIQEGMTPSEYQELIKSSDQPLFNRAISGVYPPGSTFKLVAALAGLASGKITAQTTFEDTGILRIGEFSFGNWYFLQYGKTEGMVDFLRAIARSNDIYFYKVGETVGVDTLSEWGKRLGIGQKTGIELPGEAEGVMPDPVWRKKVRNEEWYLGDTYHLAIGQGDLQTTPLQVNRWTSVIASGGELCDFTLLKTNQEKCTNLGIKKENIALVKEGMRRACYRGDDVPYQGTGWPFFDFSISNNNDNKDHKRYIPVACKTGTAEFGDPDNKTHAWFTAFAPLPVKAADDTITGDPEIVVTVLLEKGGEGSTNAGPIAKKIFEEWFKR